MADIFVSWTSKDAGVVTPLVAELRSLGFDLFEYGTDMPLGGQIADTVQNEIKSARVGLVCFDDETYNKEWIISEVSWCVAAIRDPALPMKKLIPVWVGPHPQNLLPALVDSNYPVFDLGDGSHRKVLELANRIPSEPPQVVLGAIYAMSAAQFQQVRADNPKVMGIAFYDFIDQVCSSLGMPNRPELLDLLEKRYAGKPENVAPFEGAPPVIDLVYENLQKVNEARRAASSKKLFVRWVREELNGDLGVDERDRVAAKWATGDSLLIIDSLSMWHPAVRTEFADNVPEISNSAIVWIPPFTQKLSALFPTLQNSWSIINRIRNEFMKWKDDPNRNVTCDAITDFALDRWFHRVLGQVDGRTAPLVENLQQLLQSQPGTGLTTRRMF